MAPLAGAVTWVRRRLWLVAALTLLHLLVAHLAAAPLSSALAPVIDDRPAARAMLAGDDGLTGELLSDHPSLARIGSESAQAAALLWGLFYWLLSGGILAQLDEREPERGPGALLGACGKHGARMIKVGLWGLSLRLAAVALGAGVWFALRPFSRGAGFGALELNALAALATLAIGWSLGSVALNYARAIAIALPSVRAFRAVGRGLRLAAHKLRPTLLIALFAGGGFVLTGALFHLAAHPLSSLSAGGLVALSILRVALALARVAITLTALVACGLVALERAPEPTASR
jgi:hypothetical protein